MTTVTFEPIHRPILRPIPLAILGIWFAVIFLLAQAEVFARTLAGLPIFVVIALAVPPTLFLVAWRLSGAVRAWVAALDLAMVTAVQTWRVVGAAFLMLWALGDLPLTFAGPAGLGDMAVGVFAVAVTVMVARHAAGWRRASWTLIAVGLFDFVVAFGTAILSGEGRLLDFADAPQPILMQQLPMTLIPTFAVPLFIIFHLIAWIKLSTED